MIDYAAQGEQGRAEVRTPPVAASPLLDLSRSVAADSLPDPALGTRLVVGSDARGTDLAGLSLDQLVNLRAEVIRMTDLDQSGIPASALADRDLRDAAVLLHTGLAAGAAAPFLTKDAAHSLVRHGAVLVGIDSEVDPPSAGAAGPARAILLAAGIPFVERLTNLDQVPVSGATFTAVPPKVEGLGAFPVRAFAVLP